jgi:hypothetical protein
MARDGSGTYSLPAATAAVSGDPVSSTKFNTLAEDLEADANAVRPIVAGGTGANSASAARTALGLEIGANVMAYDAGLLSLAALGSAADKYLYTTGVDVWAEGAITSFGRSLLDDADAATARTTLGAQSSAGYTAADVLSKLLTVDGAGSTLDADTLDGVQASAFAQLAGANFTGAVDNTGNFTATAFIADAGNGTGKIGLWGSASTYTLGMSSGYTYGALSDYAVVFTNSTASTQGWLWRLSTHAGNDGCMSLSGAGVLTAKSITARPSDGSVTTGTATYDGNANKQVTLTGNMTMPSGAFAAGDMGLMRAGASARTITRGSGLTMYVNGTNVSSATLTARGLMGFNYESGTAVYLTGDVS